MNKGKQIKKEKKKQKWLRTIFWFFTGVFLGLFFFLSFVYILFQKVNENVVYPGVMVNGVHFGGKTPQEIETYFAKKNASVGDTTFVFRIDTEIATVSAKDLHIGYDEKLLSEQAYSIGRSEDMISNLALLFQSYISTTNLPASYTYDEKPLDEILTPIAKKLKVEPTNALFTFENNRVTTFRPSTNGQEVDIEIAKKSVSSKIPTILGSSKPQQISIIVPLNVLTPEITTEKVNDLGIVELLATGTSLYQHSIPNRVYNVGLGASRINGVLVAPGETFSFAKTIGDISSFTGYKQAYVISGGKTVLGDGGGVCQVSTTLFRAILNAGLPIVERHAHDYRVGYYEQDSPPGIDATVYVPSIDLKFKNDTKSHILIQSIVDEQNQRLTFLLYGKKDGREVTMTEPVITGQTPPPAPVYQDDPTLPKGTVKQVDFEAWGANVYFTRQVKKDGKVVISERFDSRYRPWKAVFLRGTAE